jgi:hypothetical protein
MSKRFYDTFTSAAIGAADCGSFVGEGFGLLVVIDERDGHEDLRGSGHQSVIPYVHERMKLYCSSLPCLCEPEPFFFLSTLVKWRLPKPFITQGWAVTMSPEARRWPRSRSNPML